MGRPSNRDPPACAQGGEGLRHTLRLRRGMPPTIARLNAAPGIPAFSVVAACEVPLLLLNSRRDFAHEASDLLHLLCGTGAAIAHDYLVETQVAQLLEVVGDLGKRARTRLTPLEGTAFGLADAEK